MKLRNVGELYNTGDYQVQEWETFDLNDVQRRLHERAESLDPGTAFLRQEKARLMAFDPEREVCRLFMDFPGRFLPKDDEARRVFEGLFHRFPEPYQGKYAEATRHEKKHDAGQKE